jgi:small subunit ribosomal protein S4
MGDPQKLRKKYSRPLNMWQKGRIDEEKTLVQEYGLKNKKEVWKADSILKNFSKQAKRLIAEKSEQSVKEKNQLLKKLKTLGLLQTEADINAVLSLKLKDVLGRRLQTVVYKKNLAKSIRQARQFVVHGHINIGNKSVSIPSYLVRKKEEGQITFSQTSPLVDESHAERVVNEKKMQDGQ